MTDELFPPGLEPPPPPPELRARALDAAGRAFDAPAARDRWSAALRSPALRLAWAASVTLLLAAHLFVPSHPAPAPDPVSPEIRSIARLPRIDSRALPEEPAAAPTHTEERS